MWCLLTVRSEDVFKRTHVGLIVIQENTVMIGRNCGRSWGYSNPPSIKLFPKLFEDKTDRFIATGFHISFCRESHLTLNN